MSRAQAVVDLDAIASSTARLCAAAPTAEVMAMVKADAYGHGLVPSARAAVAGGATWLGTALLGEALALRAAGIHLPVLAWITVPGEDLAPAVAGDIDVTLSSPAGVEQLRQAAQAAGRPARAHLKVDTGLTRGGARPDEDWDDLCVAAAKAQAAGELDVVGVSSHFVHGDDPAHHTSTIQLEVFREALATAERRGLRPLLRHIASSGATLLRPEAHFDLVRPGIAVYGLSPSATPAAELGLTPAMTLMAEVALVKRVPAGTGLSYGHTHTTERETGVALVPVGYADGVPRAASNVAEVCLGGARRRVAGRVCMDQLLVELGDDDVSAGAEVLLFGPGHHGEPTAQEWADWVGTISYEIVTRIGVRVPRVHVGRAGVIST